MRAAQNTLAQNSLDLLMDCPSRERAGWINDGFFSGRAEYILTGQNKAQYNLLENYALAPENGDLEKGMLPMCYPGDFPNHDFIPNNATWFVMNLYGYYKRNGDKRLVELCKEKVYGALAYFKAFENEYELLENLKGWIFIEWSAANWKHFVRGVNFPSNMTYCKALEYAGKMYGDGELIEKSKRIKKRILEFSFNGEFFVDNAEREEHGNLYRTENMLKDEFYKWHEKYGKPIIVTEFGADTLEGVHSLPSETFSEEYQRDFYEENCRVFDEMDFVVGEHVWNLADFRTKQGVIRPRGNRKGVFTRDRQPKAAAFWLKERWKNK